MEDLILPNDVLAQTVAFAAIAYAPEVTQKNRQTQIGCHCEEVAEMLEEITAHDAKTEQLLARAHSAMSDLADHLKNNLPGIISIDPENRLAFLDAMCDQLVTGSLSAALHDMNIIGALAETNRSNFSKLVDGVMQKVPVTQKWVKGPNYTPPDLTPYI